MELDLKELKVHLEDAIDSTSLDTVLELLAEIAGEKGVHIQTNWQDDKLAQSWFAASKRLDVYAMQERNRT
jgi:hypothetical protein